MKLDTKSDQCVKFDYFVDFFFKRPIFRIIAIIYRPDKTSLFSAGNDHKIATKCLLSNENSSKRSPQLKENIQ